MQSVPVSLKTEDQNKALLNYIDSHIQPLLRRSFASAYSKDQYFINTSTLVLEVEGQECNVCFEVAYSIETGLLAYIKYECLEIPSIENKIRQFIDQSFQGIITDKKETFFKRYMYRYIGARLDGEYFKGRNLRIAPIWPEQHDSRTNIEQFFTIELKVDAVDSEDASVKGNIIADKLVAKMAFWLNLGITPLAHEYRWGISSNGNGLENRLFQTGIYIDQLLSKEMPKKGNIKTGETRPFNAEGIHNMFEKVYFPDVWRKLLAALEKSPKEINDAFDSCCFMYQMAINAGRYHPTVEASYMVAAIESLFQGEQDKTLRHFSPFIRFYCSLVEGDEQVLAFLHSDVRSKHFHSGGFEAGEYNYQKDSVISFQSVNSRIIQGKLARGKLLMRAAIYNWGVDLIERTQ